MMGDDNKVRCPSLCSGILLLLKFPGVLSDLTKDIVDLHLSCLEIQSLAILIGDRDQWCLGDICVRLCHDFESWVGSHRVVGDDP